ncbi:MAG: right-handed parallel beta-helix repeat-containing protein [Rickettsiales bacterium]
MTNAVQFQTALNRVQPGETIILAPGSYGNLTINHCGTGGQPVFIAAENPAVTRLAMPEAGERSGVGELAMNASNVTVCGLFFESGGFDSTRHKTVRTDNITYVQNYFNTGIKSFSDGVENSIAIDKGGINLTVQSNYFNATRSPSFALDYGMLLYDLNGVTIRSNVFDGVFNRPISAKENVSNALIEGNVFRGCGQACMQLGQQPDYDEKDLTGDTVTVSDNNFIDAYTQHPQSRYRLGIVLRNQQRIVVVNNNFNGMWTDVILTDFINRGGLARLQDRPLGSWGLKPLTALIENNRFSDGSRLHFTGRGNGQWDKITVRGNTGSFTCRIEPWKEVEGKKYVLSTLNKNPPAVMGCP